MAPNIDVLLAEHDRFVMEYNMLIDEHKVLLQKFSLYVKRQEEYRLQSMVADEKTESTLENFKNEAISLKTRLEAARKMIDAEKKSNYNLLNEKYYLLERAEMIYSAIFNDGSNSNENDQVVEDCSNDKLTKASLTKSDENRKKLFNIFHEILIRYPNFCHHKRKIVDPDATLSSRSSGTFISSNISSSENCSEHLLELNSVFRRHRSYDSEEFQLIGSGSVSPESLDDRSNQSAVISNGEVVNAQSNDKDAVVDRKRQATLRSVYERRHQFSTRTQLLLEKCAYCGNGLPLYWHSAKCNKCAICAHITCSDCLPLPCVVSNPPVRPNVVCCLADYVPDTPPLIPALVVYCVREIEKRLPVPHLYRARAALDKKIVEMKRNFYSSKGSFPLSQVETPVLCSLIKHFFNSLNDSLIPFNVWSRSVQSTSIESDSVSLLSALPKANRDTLAFLLLHFKIIARSKDCLVTIEDLAAMFGLILVGRPAAVRLNTDEVKQYMATAHSLIYSLLKISDDVLLSLING